MTAVSFQDLQECVRLPAKANMAAAAMHFTKPRWTPAKLEASPAKFECGANSHNSFPELE